MSVQGGGDVVILAFETSCDETSCAVVVGDGSLRVASNIVASQVELHQRFGGVVPEIASRSHVEAIIPVLDRAFGDAGIEPHQVDAVAVTFGPGLVGSLLVGLSAAKAAASALGVPLIGINHIEAHIYANFLEHPDLAPPLVCLTVSGGHTDLVYFRNHGDYDVIGRTRDDAAGEAFDKVARILGLGYPGGPAIDRLAASGDPAAVTLPRAYLEEGSYDFSFSGIKTAVLNYVNGLRQKGLEIPVRDLAASFQAAVIEVLAEKAIRAATATGVGRLALSGGVAANRGLRRLLEDRCRDEGLELYYPSPSLCTDNAAMVGCAGYYHYIRGSSGEGPVNAVPGVSLSQPGS
ncbi:MAG TPA: tRNA (adenosine(37)-N6)-threonylcarbamoyltransferase complex transferase subunit TsaD [Firmicutes bacterium]|nr:tRNA (adenosine(37)-N6)-threonylcarbamoyltransferase complex transferase subunit TsaD [Bacillota bacterium]